MTRRAPLVVVQCDAFDPMLTEQWMDAGALPTLAALRARGVQTAFAGPERVAELGMAMSLYSGVSRIRHGYYDYRQLRPGTYDLYPAAPVDAAATPFWAALTDEKIVTIDAGETMPVAGLDGIQLANWTAHQSSTRIVAPATVPSTAISEVRRSFGPAPRISEFELGSAPGDDRPILNALIDRVQRKGQLVRQYATDDVALIVVGFFEAHTAGHRFWKYHRGRADGGDLVNALRVVYSAIDREIGELLTHLRTDANVAVVSLFGMRDEYPTEGLMESFCRQLGYQASPNGHAAGVGLRSSSGSLVSRMASALPGPIRAAIGRHLPTAMQERRLTETFRTSTDWTRTRAFSIPSLYSGHVRINVRGREPHGVVEPGEEYREVVDRLEADFRAIEDPVTNAPAVRAVHRTAELFGTDLPELLPDLFVEWEGSTHFRDHVVHPRAVLRQDRPAYFRDSFHYLDGFLIAAGPDIASGGAVPPIDLLDVAPTLLSLLRRPAVPGMIGSVVRSLVAVE